MNEGILTNYENYATVDNFEEFLKEDIEKALNSLY